MIRQLLSTSSRLRNVTIVTSLLATTICTLSAPSTAYATHVRLPIERLSDRAERVIVADVGRVVSRRDERWGIATEVELRTVRALRGTTPPVVRLVLPGGSVEGETLHVTETPSFGSGERVVVFLGGDGSVIAGAQGRLGVAGERIVETGESLYRVEGRVRMRETPPALRRTSPEMFGLAGSANNFSSTSVALAVTPGVTPAATPVIAALSPAASPAGTGDTITITGSGFGVRDASSAVEFFYREGRPPIVASGAAEIPVWTDTHIEVVVPAKSHDGYPGASAGSGPVAVVTSAGRSNPRDLTVTYSIGGPFWSSASATFHVLANSATTANELAMVQAAAEEWSGPARFHMPFGGEVASVGLGNAKNEVSWQDIGAGPLARAWYWYDGSGDLTEADIQFNSDLSWIASPAGAHWDDGRTADSFDVQTVALHEFGHWLVLRDLYGDPDSHKAMYGRVANNTQRRSLSPDDVAGIVRLYGAADVTPPTTRVLDAPDGWVREAVQLHLEASDTESQVASTLYRIGEGPTAVYDGSIDVADEGVTRVRCWSVDTEGNVEPPQETWVRIDRTPPVSSLPIARPFFGGADFEIEAADSLSGVLAVHHRIDGGTVQDTARVAIAGEGTYRVEYWSRDVAGNVESTHSATVTVAAVPDIAIERIAGADRYLTAIEISRRTFETADMVVLATGRDFPDALAGSGLAGTYDAPLLLANGTVTDELAEELGRLRVTSVIIIGGPGAISTDVEDQLQDLGHTVERIAGPTRYDTAALVAERIAAEEDAAFLSQAFIVRGDAFPDALAVSPHAYSRRMPVLLVQPGTLPAATAAVLSDLRISEAIIAGGAGAVSGFVEQQLSDAGIACARVAGADRYETSARIVEYSIAEGWCVPDRLALATGSSFPDALGGGAALGASGDALLLARPDALPTCVGDALLNWTYDIDCVMFLGGTSAIGNDVVTAVKSLWSLP